MTQPSPSLSNPAQRRGWHLLSQDEDIRSLQAGLLLALILWPLLVFIIGYALSHLGGTHIAPGQPAEQKQYFNIELAQEEEPKREEKPRMDRFVETNPNAPENVPDQTRNFAAQNQQVAQEKPTPNSKSDMPALEGKKDFESNQIVSGQLSEPQPPPTPAAPPTPQEAQAANEASARREQNPLSGAEKLESEDPNGIGSNVAKLMPDATAVPEKVEGVKNAPSLTGEQSRQIRIDPSRPQPRPTINRNVRPAIFRENLMGTQNIGVTACDARWSQYGQYLQQMNETVQIQWERILDQSKAYPPPGSQVSVRFKMNSKGEISEVIKVEGSGGTQYERACVSGITSRAPYGKWPEDMIAVLGEEQEMTFTFYYGNP